MAPAGWRHACCVLVTSLLACTLQPRRVYGASVFSALVPGGDVGTFGMVGPQGRDGASAVVTDDSRVIVFGGRGDNLNGDYLNDMWLFDWATGNWTAYWPNETVVCDTCVTCDSPLSNNAVGHHYVRLDNGSYARCDNPLDLSWLNASTASRAAGAKCVYTPPCLEWTGLRPYTNPQLGLGAGAVMDKRPSGRYAHGAALVLNVVTGVRDTMVMFGGYSADCIDYCNDTWLYNLPNNDWTQPVVGTAPARRWKHAMSDYRDVAFLFGGHGMRLPPTVTGQTQLPNEIYDTSSSYNPLDPLLFGDLWSYNFTQVTRGGSKWTQMAPACLTCSSNAMLPDGTPDPDVSGPRARHSASLVTYGSSLYMFGGYSFGGKSSYAALYPTGNVSNYPSLLTKYYRDDLWVYNITNNTWAQLQPAIRGVAPSARAGHGAAVSSRGGDALMVVFGGTTWDDQVGDAWQYNFSSGAWTPLTGDGTFPSRRMAMVLVPVGQDTYTTPGQGPQSGRLLLGFGFGCQRGANYTAASQSFVMHTLTSLGGYTGYDSALSRSGNGSITAFGSYVNASTGNTMYSPTPDLWVEASAEYGEKYCTSELDDLWEYSPTACPSDCSRHGTCSYNACICDPGFWGSDCSLVTCPNSTCTFNYVQRNLQCVFCSGAGTCDGATGTCACVFPQAGTGCSQYACLNGCSGNGVCDINTPNALGYGNCTVSHIGCATPPLHHLTAPSHAPASSQCDAGYEGLDCSTTVCPSNPSPGASADQCSNNGVCVGGVCNCFPGYGPSFLYRSVSTGIDSPPLLVPVFPNGSDILSCPYEGASGCDPSLMTYVNDCGSLGYVPGEATRLETAGTAAGAAMLLALLLLEGDTDSRW